MAFKGTLDTLSIVDVFQVICMARKVGCLVVAHPGGETKRLYFHAGEIITATSNGAKDRLGAMLVKMGLLSHEQVEASRQDEQRTGVKQGQALLAQGVLTEAQLHAALGRQITEIFYGIMVWREGSFEFIDDDAPSSDMFVVRESVTNLIMQGTRQADEWGLIEKAFPNLDVVVVMTPPKNTGADIHLQPDEWQVLTLINGQRSIRDLCALSSFTNFELCKKLLNLHHAGLVATGGVATPTPPSVVMARVPASFLPTVRAELTRLVGPIAGILLEEAAESLGVSIDQMPRSLVPELTKLLCKEVDAPDGRVHLREIVNHAAES